MPKFTFKMVLCSSFLVFITVENKFLTLFFPPSHSHHNYAKYKGRYRSLVGSLGFHSIYYYVSCVLQPFQELQHETAITIRPRQSRFSFQFSSFISLDFDRYMETLFDCISFFIRFVFISFLYYVMSQPKKQTNSTTELFIHNSSNLFPIMKSIHPCLRSSMENHRDPAM